MDGIFLDEGSLGSESRLSICTEGSWLETRGVDLTSYGLGDLCFSPYHTYLGDHPNQLSMIYFFVFRLLEDEAGIAPPT